MAYTEQRKGGYVGRYRVDGKLKSTRVLKSKRDALREAEAQERAGKLSEWVDPKAGAMTVSAYFELWQEARQSRAPRTLEDERERFASLIAPRFGDTPLSRLRYEDIAAWSANMSSRAQLRKARATGTAPATASQARRRDATRLLLQVLDTAVDARRLRHNPGRTDSGKVPYLPRASRQKAHRYLSQEQLRRIVDAAGTAEARTLILLAGLTGLRWGELSALTVGDVDLRRGRVKVTKAYTRLAAGGLHLGDTKTHAHREVPIGAMVRTALARLMAGKGRSDLLFATRDGRPLRRESFARNSFEPAVTAAGHAVSALQALLGMDPSTAGGLFDAATASAVRDVQTHCGLPVTGVCDPATWAELSRADKELRGDLTQGEKVRRTHQLATLARMTIGPGAEDFARLTIHDLRHTAASLAVASGASVKTVQTLLGHESAKLTLDTYAGLFESDLDQLGELMSDGWEASGAHWALTDGVSIPAGVSKIGDRSVG